MPVGTDDTQNKLVREWGTPREFSFEALSHDEWASETGMIDFSRAAKVSGSRFVYLVSVIENFV